MAQAQMLLEHVRKLDIRPADRCLQLASMAFDVASAEIGMALVAGAALVILEDNDRVFGETLAKACEQYQITHFMCVPNALETCPIDALFSTVRCIVVGGTSCPPALVKRFGKTRMFKNAYGPTETTVFASISDALIPNKEDTHLLGLVSIGRPIQNTQIYILDASLNPLPVGVAGELYISGAGLARGYLGRSGLTAERFVANPFAQPGTIGARMYRSGDLARWTEDGVLEYLDRADGQVKIRGFRIELGEIEAALNSMPSIAQCTVQAIGKDAAKQLVAYLVAAASTDADAEASIPKPSTLRAMLSNTLPDYMVPAAFVVLEALPLTPNGKLDARALPAPEIAGEGDYRPPVTEHEQLIAALFAELTGATRVGLDDSFFALGGHSLLAMRLTARVNQACGAELSLRAIFESPTPESLALQLGKQRVKRTYRPLLTLNKTGRMPRLFCLPPAGGIATVYKNLSLALGSDHPVEGLQARGVDDDEDQFDSTMAQATQSYVDAITELQPSGPYYLLGMSLGGTIAQEVAVQLEAKGETVAAVFLIDTMTQYELPDNHSKTENEQLSELLAGLVQKDPTTDQALTPNTDELLTIFQKEWEDYGMVPVGTPRAYFLKTLKNSLMSSSLVKNHAARQCQSPIIFFKGTLDGERNFESFDWQPYTAQPIIHHKVASKHAEMLWQPASYQLIARVVKDVMANDVRSSKT
jgi:thioesterase domain-containing protein